MGSDDTPPPPVDWTDGGIFRAAFLYRFVLAREWAGDLGDHAHEIEARVREAEAGEAGS